MHHAPSHWHRRVYHKLLLLYPSHVRRRFGSEMYQLFADTWRDRRRARQRAVSVRMWGRAIRDALVNGLLFRFGSRRPRRSRSTIQPGTARERLGEIWRDLRLAVRSLRSTPGFAAVCVITIALGIGVNGAVFSVVDGVLLRSLAFPDPEELVRVWSFDPEEGSAFRQSTFAEVTGITELNQSFVSVAAYSMVPSRILDGVSTPETVELARLTADLPGVLGAVPTVGRGFTREDFRGDGSVVMISHGLWQRRYGGDPQIVGSTIHLRDRDAVIIGVLPPTFEYPSTAEAWRPFAADAYQDDDRELEILARLRSGVTVEHATVDVESILAGLRAQGADPEEVISGWVQPLRGMLVRSVRTPLVVLMGCATMVLLICCANVANLMLARVTRRRAELALRTALGAGRGRLLQALLAENMVLAGVGGVFGVLLGKVLLDEILRQTPAYTPRLTEVALDLRVQIFMLGVCVGVAVLSTVIPAGRFARLGIGESVRVDSRASLQSAGASRMQRALIVAEIGVSTVLVFIATLLVGTFVNLWSLDRGFSTAGLLSIPVSVAEDHGSRDEVRAFYGEIANSVRQLPGVSSVALSFRSPLETLSFRVPVRLQSGERSSGAGPDAEPYLRSVSPDYFRTVGIPLRAGRAFTSADHADASRVAIINETFARNYFREVPVGRSLFDRDGSIEIVGVVADVTPTPESVGGAAMYVPFDQEPIPFNYVLVRTATDPAALIPSIRRIIWSLNSTVALDDIATIEDTLAVSMATPRFVMFVTGTFAVLALCLASVGVYGMMSYAITSRTREFALRRALGARSASVLIRVFADGARVTGLGVVVGVVLVAATSRFMTGMLYGVTASSPLVLAAVVGVLALVSTGACLLPAVRATRVVPLVALRAE